MVVFFLRDRFKNITYKGVAKKGCFSLILKIR